MSNFTHRRGRPRNGEIHHIWRACQYAHQCPAAYTTLCTPTHFHIHLQFFQRRYRRKLLVSAATPHLFLERLSMRNYVSACCITYLFCGCETRDILCVLVRREEYPERFPARRGVLQLIYRPCQLFRW